MIYFGFELVGPRKDFNNTGHVLYSVRPCGNIAWQSSVSAFHEIKNFK